LIIKLHCFIKFAFNGVASISQLGNRFCMLTKMDSSLTFFGLYVFSILFTMKLSCSHFIVASLLYYIFQHLLFFKKKLFFDWFIIDLHVFFFYGAISILCPWLRGWWVNLFWLFLKVNFFSFQFSLLTLSCLIIEFYDYIQFAFDGVTSVSQPSHIFDVLI
jgi:hypothetical protein